MASYEETKSEYLEVQEDGTIFLDTVRHESSLDAISITELESGQHEVTMHFMPKQPQTLSEQIAEFSDTVLGTDAFDNDSSFDKLPQFIVDIKQNGIELHGANEVGQQDAIKFASYDAESTIAFLAEQGVLSEVDLQVLDDTMRETFENPISVAPISAGDTSLIMIEELKAQAL